MFGDTRTLSASERLDWLRLIRSENVGPRTFIRLLERYGSAARALAELPELAKRGGRARPIVVCPKDVGLRELDAAAKLGCTVLAACEPGYPRLLAAIDDPPPILYARGNPSLLGKSMIAMVGARNASINGRNLTRRMAADLGRSGLGVVSGLARGIDTAAHEGSLSAGTVAVVAGGVEVVYPPENQKLYDDIVAMGCVVSEMPPGTQPQASHFPRRNRIVSGMALAVVVVEASLKSGSLITARMAAEQGREVFAVPGHPMDPRAQGPNDLIRHGATLTESADDVTRVVLDLLRRPLAEDRHGDFVAQPETVNDEKSLAYARALVLESLGPMPVAVDLLIRECQLSASVVSMVLLELELAGRLERHPGQQVALLVAG
ncbi:DNA-processing protein DprA [Magnetospirillum sulfuroxidans]|uniref:DNA-processing protein DprA n=1 Tax=Magnetospirillum sulfuroxidans TaxID=611300 RepID=A0ABS5IBY0_9PROT|nr:DNA-processing protein DprA [Magnetospirillum sulfuroxidans]MBR9971927.1 DNA-processing protein DprA [Magnetospirillum sulfuroxidans]